MQITDKLLGEILENTEWQSSKEILGTTQTLETIYGKQGNEPIYELTAKMQKIAWKKEEIEKKQQLEVLFDNIVSDDSNEQYNFKSASYEGDSRIFRYEFKNSEIKSENELMELFEDTLKIEIFSSFDCTGQYFSSLQLYHVAKNNFDSHVIYDLQQLDN